VASAPPVYAPALVAFVGGGGGGVSWGVSLSIGGAATPGLAWFPLGPGEVWHPGWGGWSPRYYERVNQTVIVNRNVNITNIHNTYINYHAPGAVTAVPATAFVHGKPVAHFAQRVDPRQWANARINPGAAGVAPVRASLASGLRPATYHPPQTLNGRPVVATHAPVTPPAYRDQLAQHLAQAGGRVPGAGAPVVRPAGPAPFAGGATHGLAGAPSVMPHNVRVVDTHSPVITPTHGPANAAQRLAEPGRKGELAQPQIGARPGEQHAPGPEQPPLAPHAPATMEHAQPNNGVPRPPATVNGPAAHGERGGAQPNPAWTQPHAPVSEQRMPANEAHAGAGGAPGQPAQPMQRGAPQPQAAPHAPMHESAAQPGPRIESQPQSQQHFEPSRPQPQVQPHVEQPRPQPQPQPHFEQPRPQPQPQPHFEQPRPQPQPQPHFEQPRPQPQPQPHIEQPHPQPRQEPAPQQHQQHEPQHAAAPSQGGQERHRG
jgi:hypothetical protein